MGMLSARGAVVSFEGSVAFLEREATALHGRASQACELDTNARRLAEAKASLTKAQGDVVLAAASYQEALEAARAGKAFDAKLPVARAASELDALIAAEVVEKAA
jgi:hypothetical protein